MSLLLTVTIASALAVQLASPALSDEVRVANSGSHTLVIGPDGTVLCQGRNQHGVCGADSTTQFVEKLSPVPGVPKGRAVAVADPWTSMVLGEDGRVYVWGQNNFGLFGGTDRGPAYVRQKPTPLTSLDRVIGIAAFEHGGAALRDDGTVWMWGEDSEGLLATGALTQSWRSGKQQFTPQRVAGTDGVVQIVGGSRHMLAHKSDGTVRTLGGNSFGSLGTGGGVDAQSSRGVVVRSISGIVRVWAGGNRDLALKSDGTLYMRRPSGSEEAGVFRVPKVMATFTLGTPRKP